MLYALLAAVSSVLPKITPTATPIPIATATLSPTVTLMPTPTASPAPLDISIVNGVSFVDIIGLILQIVSIAATVYLGYTALKASENANKASDTANTIAKRQIENESFLRDFEHRIAAFDKVTFVHNFFTNDIKESFFYGNNKDDSVKKVNSVDNVALYLFDEDTYRQIKTELDRIRGYLDSNICSYRELIDEVRLYDSSKTDEEIHTMVQVYFANDFRISVEFLRIIMASKIKPILKKYKLNLKPKREGE